MKRITIEVAVKVPSWNEFFGRGHWSDRWKANKMLINLTVAMAKNALRAYGIKEPIKKAIISYFVYYSGLQIDKRTGKTRKIPKKHDFDNCVLKPFNDALVKSGVIEADDSEHLSCGGIVLKTNAPADTLVMVVREDKSVDQP